MINGLDMKTKEKNKEMTQNDISRKDALKKIGLGAFTATTMMLLLNNPKAQAATSADQDQAGGLDDWSA